jgi:hypothetical protein
VQRRLLVAPKDVAVHVMKDATPHGLCIVLPMWWGQRADAVRTTPARESRFR